MTYIVKELFYSVQGEGANVGRPAVFCRFTGCNLWNGHEEGRASAVCQFCDTDFVGTDGTYGGRYESPDALADAIRDLWPATTRGFVVCTGGEPLLQFDNALLRALHERSFTVAVETNGTITPPAGIDWLCVSPKAGVRLHATSGQELKIVFPQEGLDPAAFSDLTFDHFFLQPKDGPARDENTRRTLAYCLAHPVWRVSLQTHKYLGVR